jgi:hypothetical protein
MDFDQVFAELVELRSALSSLSAQNEGLATAFGQIRSDFCEVLQLVLSEIERGSPAGAEACLRRALAGYAGRPAGAVLQ